MFSPSVDNLKLYSLDSCKLVQAEAAPLPIKAMDLLNTEQSLFRQLAASDNVHLWLISLDAGQESATAAFDFLNPDEKRRAQDYLSKSKRHRFIISRAILRRIIRGYLKSDTSPLKLSAGKHGKPFYESAQTDKSIRFNVSHSGDLTLIGFSQHHEIGVDIEQERYLKGLAGIAENVLSERELEFFLKLTEPEKRAVFFRLWTCKESSLKADGVGFHRDPKSHCLFTESKAQNESLRVLRTDSKAIQWASHPLGYSMAWTLKSDKMQEVHWMQI